MMTTAAPGQASGEITLFLCGDVMTGRGIDQILPHPAGSNRIAEMRKHLPEVMPLYANAKKTQLAALAPYQSNVPGLAPIQ